MRNLALIAGILFALVLLNGCTSVQTDPPYDFGDNSNQSEASAAVTGMVNGKNIHLDQALITTRNRTLGLAMYNHKTNPEMLDLEPGAWYLGLSFKYDMPGPEVTLNIVDYDQIHTGPVARARLIQANKEGKPFRMKIKGGTLQITDWTETGELITDFSGSVELHLVGGGTIKGEFTAPVQGWYLSP